MRTRCNGAPVGFNRHGRRDVTADSDGGRLSTDAGAVLLREAGRRDPAGWPGASPATGTGAWWGTACGAPSPGG